ncbi:putative glycine-tRNA ligase [Venturia nashicola]|uniref:Putative glycine--tRNA ligase n=1 Tax=Venturia nashicola TaxID=86259 RepID=A0A4Z1NN63_9PEZI|nr:putative glycine--tRNA ligase [Venturia nashicola]TLD23598.1 putative glycine-tRNA ligase [Venturia nashicola]
MPTDKQNVEFIWAIVKQLEVKHVDWSTVASANSISNGHAARMRFHRLRRAMEGIATKHRTPKIDEPSEKSKGKDKHNCKMPKLRKAKYLALKRKLAAISDDEEEPLAHVKARMRMKRELEDDSEDEYVDSETEEKRAVLKRIKREEATERVQDERSVSPTTVKAEIEECPSALSSGRKSMPEKMEVMEDDVATLEPKPIKDEAVEEDGAIMIESPPTSADDFRVKQEVFEILVEV